MSFKSVFYHEFIRLFVQWWCHGGGTWWWWFRKIHLDALWLCVTSFWRFSQHLPPQKKEKVCICWKAHHTQICMEYHGILNFPFNYSTQSLNIPISKLWNLNTWCAFPDGSSMFIMYITWIKATLRNLAGTSCYGTMVPNIRWTTSSTEFTSYMLYIKTEELNKLTNWPVE